MPKLLNEWDDEPDDEMISLAQRRAWPFSEPPNLPRKDAFPDTRVEVRGEYVPRARSLKALALIIEMLNKRVLRMSGLTIYKVDGKIRQIGITFD